MSRRAALWGLVLIAVLGGVWALGPRWASRPAATEPATGATAAGSPVDLPNIVLIVVCTLRADYLPFYGYEENTAPFLASLAAKSVVFENAFSTSAWTAPSTASIHTSLYPIQHGVIDGMAVTRNRQRDDPSLRLNRIPDERDTVADVLRRHGYTGYAVTDNLNIVEEMGFAQGFERFRNLPYRGAASVNEELFDWESEIKSNAPYFVYLHYMDPHLPYHKRPPWFPSADPENPETPGPGDGLEGLIEAYESEIRYLDLHIQEAFERFGWERDTFVIIVAGHGEEFGDHGGMAHGHSLFQELIRVPLLIHDTRHTPPRRIRTEVSGVDILPTLRELVGEPAQATDEGRSLLGLMDGSEPGFGSRPLFAHLRRFTKGPESQLQIGAVMKDGWKYIRSNQRTPEMLFNLREDAGERENLVTKSVRTADELRADLEQFERTAPRYDSESFEQPLDDEKIEQLEALGYVD